MVSTCREDQGVGQGVKRAAGLQAIVDCANEIEWNSTVEEFADANIYQTWAYGAVQWGGKQLSHLILRRGSQLIGAAQIRILRVPAIGGVAYVRWGPLCERAGVSISEGDYGEVMKSIVDEYVVRRRLVLRIVPHAFVGSARGEICEEILRGIVARQTDGLHPYRTLVLDIQPELKVLRAQLNQKWRNQLNRAEDGALEVKAGKQEDLFEEFIKIYDAMMVRKKFSTTLDPRAFLEIQRRLPEGQRMIVFLAHKESRAVAGVIVSALGDSGIYLLGATNEEGMRCKGSYLLHWSAIQWLKDIGMSYYDLGGIDPEHNPGVFHFKKGFSGKEAVHVNPRDVSVFGGSEIVVRVGDYLRCVTGKLLQKN